MLTADITDAYPVLPPAAGADRWFARVTGGEGGNFDSFTITTDGLSYAATRAPRLDEIDGVAARPAPAGAGGQPPLDGEPRRRRPAGGAQPAQRRLGHARRGDRQLVALSPDITVGGRRPRGHERPWASGEQLVLTGPTVTVAQATTLPAAGGLQLSDKVESWACPSPSMSPGRC